LLVEIQALVSKSSFGYARRRAQGFDFNRLSLLIAVLEKRIGLHLEAEDVFVNVAGGIKIEDPTADLAVAAAIASAFREELILAETIVLGEVGLAGEIRSISHAALRVNEAQKLGFKRCVLPRNNLKGIKTDKSMELLPCSSLKEALDILLSGGKP
jgi:DNA repair protein RadA/Sms